MKQSTSYQSYKALYAAALERLCDEHPEADLDDLKREAERQVTEMRQELNKEGIGDYDFRDEKNEQLHGQ